MTSTDTRPCVTVPGPPDSEVSRRKAVLFCPVCGHESSVDGDWIVVREDSEERSVCPDCGHTVSGR